jgi:hypothetical protein
MKTILVKAFTRPAFLVAALSLLVTILGFHLALHTLGVFLSKERVDLQRPLYMIPKNLGPYTLESIAEKLPHEIETVLGADAYITIQYRDTRETPLTTHPVRLHLAYYTGTPDMVLHRPEICYVAGGARPTELSDEEAHLTASHFTPGENGKLAATARNGKEVKMPDNTVPLRVFQFVPKQGGEPATVAYTFVANNMFIASYKRIRAQVFNIAERYAYWCKVEVLPMEPMEQEKAVRVVEDFLNYALVEIYACLPDWEKLHQKD